MTRRALPVAALALLVLALTGGAWAAGPATEYPPRLPAKAQRILEHDWCAARSYDAASRVPGFGTLARRNFAESARIARAHPGGCRHAEAAAHALREHLPSGARCPSGALALPGGARHAAGIAAAAAEGRLVRPVLAGYDARAGEVRHMCGSRMADRTVVVSLLLTAYTPSASLSDREVAVSLFPGRGWRVWGLLH